MITFTVSGQSARIVELILLIAELLLLLIESVDVTGATINAFECDIVHTTCLVTDSGTISVPLLGLKLYCMHFPIIIWICWK